METPPDSVVDDAQLTFMGVPPEQLGEIRSAVDAHMQQFLVGPGTSRFPLAFQIFQARNP